MRNFNISTNVHLSYQLNYSQHRLDPRY